MMEQGVRGNIGHLTNAGWQHIGTTRFNARDNAR
jgi:hypothetical protein